MKKPFYTVKKIILQGAKNRIFPKGLTHDFKMRQEIMFKEFLDNKNYPVFLL